MKRILLPLSFLAVSAVSAHALDARATNEVGASASDAWAAIGDFCGIASWHPAVAKCDLSEKDGATFRTLTLKDGAKLLEKLVSRDDKTMSYSYTIEEGPLPVSGYKSTIKVVSDGKATSLDWVGSFDAKGATDAEAVKAITGIYEAGLGSLAEKLSN